MPYLAVCSLARIPDTARHHAPSHMLTVISGDPPVPRPESVIAARHLRLNMNDIAVETPGMITPGETHVRQIIGFAHGWDRKAPMLIHCYAGVSRSTASAYMIALALNPDLDALMAARLLRLRSSTATPNPKLVAIADDVLGRGGAMVDAIGSIGRGADCFEGAPFVFPVSDDHADQF
ncbi:MAG: tyrosine protein phosphatase [Roseitalea sp.]|jgi:predicted protein tyrosine phosphatase|nr:tyrosine protein phosphatase [Roseitalea sp.]MBO6722967.1 tyrosine protein phosphatase [Roseitalea sp.]MBO6744118.1 tyrosine protein phosphatase [Roseitalea sp.]